MSARIDPIEIVREIGKARGFGVQNITVLAGGSINQVFLLSTSQGKKVLKLNSATEFPGMFPAEKVGLETIKKTGTFQTPAVIAQEELGEYSFLILEYISGGTRNFSFWKTFAENLASLHRSSAPDFGFSISNYIGSLPQSNESKKTASEFYIDQRLEPQVRQAVEKGYKFNSLDKALKNISSAIPEEPPALIHGDLWSGNYLVTDEGLPCLIDPAVSFGPREMDLAMMNLFGGFPREVFDLYTELFPILPGFSERVPLWQLYYLLVHLNIFGSSYFSSVKSVLKDFS